VYPGGNFEEHLRPFTEGAFSLNGGTKTASAVMPYYTISYGADQTYSENVGNSFSKYIVNDLLRERFGYDGVVCTDWGITHDMGKTEEEFAGKCWGVETLTEAERHLKALEAGVDQFGGNNDAGPVLENTGKKPCAAALNGPPPGCSETYSRRVCLKIRTWIWSIPARWWAAGNLRKRDTFPS